MFEGGIALIERQLVDEYHLLMNPVAFGKGEAIFTGLTSTLPFTLMTSRVFSSCTILHCYKPTRFES